MSPEHYEPDFQTRFVEEFVESGDFERSVYGHQWGIPGEGEWLNTLVDDWITPVAEKPSTNDVVEIGSGGGRWFSVLRNYSFDRVVLVDGTPASETAIRHWWDDEFMEFLVSKDGTLPSLEDQSVDYVWSYDTFVHFPTLLMDTYVREIGRILRPGGTLHIHYAHKPSATIDHDGLCFVYRDRDEVAGVLKDFGLSVTRENHLGGWGSIMLEALKE